MGQQLPAQRACRRGQPPPLSIVAPSAGLLGAPDSGATVTVMTSAAATNPVVRVGVALPLRPERLGEWLADASAYDAAGVDAIWLEVETETGLDPLALLAALAVTTYRSRLVLSVGAGDLPPGAAERILDTVRRLSRNRITLVGAAEGLDEIVDRVGAVPVLARGESATDVGVDDDPPAPLVAARSRDDADGERWLRATSPEDRAAWQVTLSDATDQGVTGVVVDASPLLIDILRNPVPTGDRHEMHIATG